MPKGGVKCNAQEWPKAFLGALRDDKQARGCRCNGRHSTTIKLDQL